MGRCPLALVLVVAAACAEAAQLITLEDFHSKIAGGAAGEVWVVVFGTEADASGEEIAAAEAVQKEASWVNVGWMDILDVNTRLLADAHGIAAYPAIKVFTPEATLDVPKKDQLTLKNAVEKWLPSRMENIVTGAFKHVLPVAEDEADFEVDGIPTCVCYAQKADVLAIAGLRALSMKYWERITMVLKDSDGWAGVRCGEVDYEGDYKTVAKALAKVAVEKDTEAMKEAIVYRRQSAVNGASTLALPQLNSMKKWTKVMEGKETIDIVFLLDSSSKKHENNFEVAKNLVRRQGKGFRVAYSWIDFAVEDAKIAEAFGFVKANLPAVAVVLTAQAKTQSGEETSIRATLPIPTRFTFDEIAAYMDKELQKGQGIRPIDHDKVRSFSADGELDTTAPQDDTIDALVFSKDAQKRGAANKKAKKPKKKKTKLTAKELEKLEQVKEEVAAKKAARAQRIKEKKEKEAAEKVERKKEQKEEKKKRIKAKKEEKARKAAEEKKKAEEAARKKEEKRKAAEEKRLKEEKKREEKRKEAQRRREEAQRRKEEREAREAKEAEEKLNKQKEPDEL